MRSQMAMHSGIEAFHNMMEFFFPGWIPTLTAKVTIKQPVKKSSGQAVLLPLETIIAAHVARGNNKRIERIRRDIRDLNAELLATQRAQQQLRAIHGVNIGG